MEETFFLSGKIVIIQRDISESEPYYKERRKFILERIGFESLDKLILYSITHCDAIFYRTKYNQEIEKELTRLRTLIK